MKRTVLAALLVAMLALPLASTLAVAGPSAPSPEVESPEAPRAREGGPPDLRGALGPRAADPVAPPPWTARAVNHNNSTPTAQIVVEDVGSRASGARVLVAYSLLAFQLVAAEGDSIIFQADAAPGQFFDCYLFNATNYALYSTIREGGDPEAEVVFFDDYSSPHTEHASFTTEPLPAGTYYVVVDNDERLQKGANPEGNITVQFAVALVNNSLPVFALFVVLAGASAAIYATVRWRPIFDAGSPLLDVDGGVDGDGVGGGESPHPDMDEGEGPPPHPP